MTVQTLSFFYAMDTPVICKIMLDVAIYDDNGRCG